MRKVFIRDGWLIGHNRSSHICPDCSPKKAKQILPTSPVPSKWTTPAPEWKPIEPLLSEETINLATETLFAEVVPGVRLRVPTEAHELPEQTKLTEPERVVDGRPLKLINNPDDGVADWWMELNRDNE
jgi:hypothetical protein